MPFALDPMEPLLITPRRAHLARLMAIWRSAGWPYRDAIELDLLAAGWARASLAPGGHETLVPTETEPAQRLLGAPDVETPVPDPSYGREGMLAADAGLPPPCQPP